jgi:hypothetical protein
MKMASENSIISYNYVPVNELCDLSKPLISKQIPLLDIYLFAAVLVWYFISHALMMNVTINVV